MKKAGQNVNEKSGKMEKAARKNIKNGSATVESLLPTGSREWVAVGIAAAAGGLLLATATLGVGPAALAGAAGYLAYRGMSGAKKQ
jgi:alkylhydroperoxidase/carboxymuconolactone decarboxylase family protein YurZ